MARITQRLRIRKLSEDGGAKVREDQLAAEEPLQLLLNEKPFTITMRTPGDDFDLVAGFLVGEGVIHESDHLRSMRFCAGEDEQGRQTYNVIQADLAPGVALPDEGLERHIYTTSACGICGTASIDAVRKKSTFELKPVDEVLSLDVLLSLPDRLREKQQVFDRTGGVHAAGLFDFDGNLLCLREDVGRHNAVDKVIGWALRSGKLPLENTVLQVSGRASFELVQKAAMAGIPVLSAVSAPSSLAVELAKESGLTLAGFSRGTSVNVYSHARRVYQSVLEDPAAENASGAVSSAASAETHSSPASERHSSTGAASATGAQATRKHSTSPEPVTV